MSANKNTTMAFALGAVLWVSGCCSGRLCRVDAQVWAQSEFNQQRRFPERYDPHLAVPKLKGLKASSPTFGVVLSGGGTRSASASLGQLRALRELGWLDKTHYISAVSGGSWAAVPYTYLQGGKAEDAKFLGAYLAPDALTKERWTKTHSGSLARAIRRSTVGGRTLKGWFTFKGDETFAYIVSDIFLGPFGLGDTRRWFTAHRGALEHLVGRAGPPAEYYFLPGDFYTSRDSRPYLIVGATVLVKGGWCKKLTPTNIYPLEITQLYSGVPTVFAPNAPHRDRIGGGWIESFAYDSVAPPRLSKPYTSINVGRRRFRFTLGDVIAASGAAPQAILNQGAARCATAGLSANLGFPEFRHWPVSLADSAREYAHGDGGNLDNVGLLPLLSRRVSHILVFVNTKTPFSPAPAGKRITSAHIYGDIIDYFRPSRIPRHNAEHNNVIAASEELARLHNAFAEDRAADRPLIHCQRYQIKANPRHNIVAYQPQICWVYLDRTEPWLRRVGANANLEQYATKMCTVRAGRCRSSKPFKRFPHYRTFFENLGVIALKPSQVHALADLTAWAVIESQQEIRDGMKGLSL